MRAARCGNRTEAGMPENAPLEVPRSNGLLRHFHNWKCSNSLVTAGWVCVFKARQPHLDRFVASRCCGKLARDPRFAERFSARAACWPAEPSNIVTWRTRRATWKRWNGRTGDLGRSVDWVELAVAPKDQPLILITATAAFLAWDHPTRRRGRVGRPFWVSLALLLPLAGTLTFAIWVLYPKKLGQRSGARFAARLI